jgi:hypothetical protein
MGTSGSSPVRRPLRTPRELGWRGTPDRDPAGLRFEARAAARAHAKAGVCEILGVIPRRGLRGEPEGSARVSPMRRQVLREPPVWPPGWAGFEKPWGEVGEDATEETAARFDDELRREVQPGHPLHERECIAIAKREATDDVLFDVGAEEVAVVHLTWAGKPEPPPWPSTELYRSLEHFMAAAPDDFAI